MHPGLRAERWFQLEESGSSAPFGKILLELTFLSTLQETPKILAVEKIEPVGKNEKREAREGPANYLFTEQEEIRSQQSLINLSNATQEMPHQVINSLASSPASQLFHTYKQPQHSQAVEQFANSADGIYSI